MVVLRLCLIASVFMICVFILPSQTPYSSAAPIRIGVQAGHWKSSELPARLAHLRPQTGTSAAGVNEVDINLRIAQRVVALLTARGYAADLLPATIPQGYAPDVFIALHADGSLSPSIRGFKAARPTFRAPSDPARDDRLVQLIYSNYGSITGLPRDHRITTNMTHYYAFSSHLHPYAVPATTASAILEMGFVTNPSDRAFLTSRSDLVAEAIVTSIVTFVQERGSGTSRGVTPASTVSSAPAAGYLSISVAGANVRTGPSTNYNRITVAFQNERYQVIGRQGEWLQIWLPSYNRTGWVWGELVTTSSRTLS